MQNSQSPSEKKHLALAKEISPKSVRISVIDRCDMSCIYCVPDKSETQPLSKSERLSDDSIVEIVSALMASGTKRVRLTGGEPLLRPGIVDLVRRLALLGLSDLALTTNATLLEKLAFPLKNAGLTRLNVSLDSLNPETFSTLTRGGSLDRVLRGIQAATSAGFDKIGLNSVCLRGLNDLEAPQIVDFAWNNGHIPRFIELMKIGGDSNFWHDRFVSADETFALLGSRVEGPLADARQVEGRGPARYREAADGSGHRVGFITGSSHTFCEGCDRLRVSSDGKLRACLASNSSVDIAKAALAHDSQEIQRSIKLAWSEKPNAPGWNGCNEHSASEVDMTSTGG